uniref:60S ribosomal protein L13a n=1 Tax=Strombidium rassoulzadegani TaxID=1082188 RepID=A0A7S3CSZ5_9SPIT
MFEKEIVIDGRGHLVGRLASKVAKELLRGQRVVVVRCEQLVLSGSLFRNNITYHEFLRKSNNTNPRRNFKHFRSPSRMFWRSLRGMLPHKSPKGKAALQRLKVFEGIPFPYDVKKRMVVPEALKVLRIKPHRNTCLLGDLASGVGWTKKDIVETLEQKRKVKSEKFFQAKQKKLAARAKALTDKKLVKVNQELAKHGF